MRPRIYPEPVSVERRLEKQRRYQAARQRALVELRATYSHEYYRLLDFWAKQVDAERGPLPGDEVTA